MPEHTHQVFPRTLCIIKNQDKFLMLKYSEKKGAMQGFYNFSGGHIEFGEGIIASANREIYEETSLIPKITKLKGVVHAHNFFGKNVAMFVTISEVDTSETTKSEEGDLCWIEKNEIDSLQIFQDIKLILDKINSLSDEQIFTATSEFDGSGGLVRLEFE